MTHPTVNFFWSTIFSKISMFLFANIGHVSSANSVVLKFDTFGKSLTYSEKNRGDKIDPCGKPKLICWVWDLHYLLLYIVLAYVNNFQKVVVGALECHRNVPTNFIEPKTSVIKCRHTLSLLNFVELNTSVLNEHIQ